MNLTLKWIAAAAVTALTATAAQAQLSKMDTSLAGSSLAFIALDTTGTPTSLFVNLGYLMTDFDPGSVLAGSGQNVVWNFNNNTVLENGAAKSGTFNWSGQFGTFDAVAQAPETRFAVIGGLDDQGTGQAFHLSTGKPTALNIANQINTGATANMVLVNDLYTNSANKGTLGAPGAGAFAQVGGGLVATGYVGNPGLFGASGNWRTNLSWNATALEGNSTDFYYLGSADTYTVDKIDGAFSYNAGVLTWQTVAAPIPEPSVYALFASGLAVLGFVGRRRRKQD